MISDLNDFDGSREYRADICIIGAGVAGLTIAKEFLNTSTNVLLLESGGKKDELRTQRLYETELTGLPHEGVHNGRFRVYGGSSTRWGAQLMTFEPLDIGARDYIGLDAWPVSFDEVAQYYDRAQAVLHVNNLSYEDDVWKELSTDPIAFDKDRFHYRFSKWADFTNRNLAKTIGPACEAAENIEILLHANVTEILPREDEESVESVCICSLSGKKTRVQASIYIICCGAIETARVMLASNSVRNQGLGNENDLVGRYFQDHVSIRAAKLKPADRKRFTATFDPFFRDQTMHSPKIVMTPEAQRKNGCVNVMGHIVFAFTEESGLYELRKILRAVQSKSNPIPSPMGAWRILRYSSDAFRMVFGQFLAKRRLSPKLASCHLDIECEQAPSPDSRVVLSKQRDELGMPRALLDWRLSDIEKHSARKFVENFREEWNRLELGTAEWSGELFEEGDAWMNAAGDTYHHTGTTRMSNSPSTGVVDADLRVHGINNLYIASTSVFPTGSCANPTLTMMALCMRLADHLKSRSGSIPGRADG